MAEAIFNHIAKKEGLDVRAVSAGLAAGGAPMSKNSAYVLAENRVHIVFDINEGEYLTIIANLCLGANLSFRGYFACHNS